MEQDLKVKDSELQEVKENNTNIRCARINMSKNVYKGEKVCLTKEKMAGIHTHTDTHTLSLKFTYKKT